MRSRHNGVTMWIPGSSASYSGHPSHLIHGSVFIRRHVGAIASAYTLLPRQHYVRATLTCFRLGPTRDSGGTIVIVITFLSS